MIKAVIFDCFGVLISCKLPILFKQHTNKDPNKWQRFTDLCQKADIGEITSDQLWPQIAELMELSLDECHRIVDAERHPNYELLQYIREDLRGNYKVGLLSNAGQDIWQYVTPDIRELFDVSLISAELHRAKPDIEAFEEVCRQLGVSPEQALMIDDSLANCVSAKQTGLSVVQYQSFPQFRAEVSDMLIVV